MEETTKFCVNCEHYEGVTFVSPRCKRTKHKRLDLVTGEVKQIVASCLAERWGLSDRCGPEGKFFKQKG